MDRKPELLGEITRPRTGVVVHYACESRSAGMTSFAKVRSIVMS